MLSGALVLLARGAVFEAPVFHGNAASEAILAWFVVMASIVPFGACF